MTNLHETYVAKLGFELLTPGMKSDDKLPAALLSQAKEKWIASKS